MSDQQAEAEDAARWRYFAEHAAVEFDEDGGVVIYLACDAWEDQDPESLDHPTGTAADWVDRLSRASK